MILDYLKNLDKEYLTTEISVKALEQNHGTYWLMLFLFTFVCLVFV